MTSASQVLEQDKAVYPHIEPRCRYFGTCGGCSLQDLSYPDQLALKRQRLIQSLAPLGPLPPLDLIGMDDPWRYRGKAEFTFGQTGDGALTLGYHAAGSFWRIVDLEDCLLMPEAAMRIVRDALSLASRTGLPAYHPTTHQGFFRYVVVRRSCATEQVALVLITTPGHRQAIEPIAQALRATHPRLCSVYWGTSARLADVARPEELVLLAGEPQLEEQVGPFRLQLDPLSFLQPNPVLADRMYATLADAAGGLPDGTAWDLYCGVGLVSLYLAGRVRRVYGIDVEPHHLELAGRNAQRHGITNVEFRTGQVETLLMDRRFWLQEAKPDLIVVDPPRAGFHPQALSSLLAARAKRILYLSCNVQSLVRDLTALGKGFPRYQVSLLRAFDMFPQTNHLETLAVLER